MMTFLKKISNANEIRVTFVIKPELISGFMVKIGSTIYDYTIQDEMISKP